MIYAVQAHMQHGKLCLAVFCYLCSCVQCLADVSLHYLFSSWAARGRVGEGNCSSWAVPVAEHFFLFWRNSFLYPFFCWVIPYRLCDIPVPSLLIYNVAIHIQVYMPTLFKSWRTLTPLLAFSDVLIL